MRDTWDERELENGWHWLIRRKDGAPRAGFYNRFCSGWRISDAIGRTVHRSNTMVMKHYFYLRPIEQPKEIAP